MNRNILKSMLIASAGNQGYENFTAGETQTAVRKAMLEHFGIDQELTLHVLREKSNAIFALIDEVLMELVPKEIEANLGLFAEIRNFSRNDKPQFKIENKGKRRVMKSVTSAAPGGLYRAKRLDQAYMEVFTRVDGVAVQITLEELLTGVYNISDLVNLVSNGYTEKVFIEIVKQLKAMEASLPAKNKHSQAYGLVDTDALDNILSVVSQYGTPNILCFEEAAKLIRHDIDGGGTYTPNISQRDVEEIRNRGYVSSYHTTPILIIPNYLVDENNSGWVFKRNMIYVIPSGVKPVKIAFMGAPHTEENKHAHGGRQYDTHWIWGVGVYYYNNIGMIKITSGDITEGEV